MTDMNENAETQQEYFGKSQIVAGMTIQEDVLKLRIEKVDDKIAYENLIIKYAELENKIADIKANCDLAIEGRDVKIDELEEKNSQMFNTIALQEQQIEKLKADLNNAIESASNWYEADPVYSLLVDIYNDNFGLKEIEK